jgi:type 1 glutamine amidotransferase
MKIFGLAMAAGLGALMVASCSTADLGTAQEACIDLRADAGTRVLVFSHTAGYRHASIPTGVAAIGTLGERHGFSVVGTADPAEFTDSRLAEFDAVVFLNTTGDLLDARQQGAFERYIRGGGGYVGVHAAADTEYDWDWYGRLVGAYFKSHPRVQPATVRVVDRSHLSTRCLPEAWTRTDEWYDYRAVPAAEVTILANLDESSYEGGQMGGVHPIIWYHEYDGGRAWYTGLGHTEESFSEPAFLDHLAGGILWVVGN